MKPISLNELFKQKIFRIPDYQRGYAWQKKQYQDFWEDIINLQDDKFHYTGVLSLKEVEEKSIQESDNEFWLIEDHSYKIYDIVDGQQRLTTCIIFLQSLIEIIREIPENEGKKDEDIFMTESLPIKSIVDSFLYKTKPIGGAYKTYKFGYHYDNPSYEFMKYVILGEGNPGTIIETFYTLNLKNAKIYFKTQIREQYLQNGQDILQSLYKKISKRFLFNQYIIEDEFDVFVAFETMNNRGKTLSNLELLKNRLIYLTTLYSDDELDRAGRKNLRNIINEAWKEIYFQLGRNVRKPLSDDDFLKAHWIITFKYSRKKGDDYINFLLNEYFSPKKIFSKLETIVELDTPEEISESINSDIEEGFSEFEKENTGETLQNLKPQYIEEYVVSLKSSAVHWFESHYPFLSTSSLLQDDVKSSLDRLNRLGMGYFRPLVTSLLKNVFVQEKRLEVLYRLERFIFLAFRIGRALSNYGDSEFYNTARDLEKKEITTQEILDRISQREKFLFREDGSIKIEYFLTYMDKRFSTGGGGGYYGWNGLVYFLYEYEQEQIKSLGKSEVKWDDLFLKNEKDKISIEHIFPQTPNNNYWKTQFKDILESQYQYYAGSIGNLLLLSSSINSSLQNDSFDEKKNPKYNQKGECIRKGYSNGSHSEIEITHLYPQWGPEQIRERGIKLLQFLSQRWDIRLSEEDIKKLLFI